MTTGRDPARPGRLRLAHAWRMVVEPRLATHPSYLVATVAAALLSLWAGRLVWRSRSP